MKRYLHDNGIIEVNELITIMINAQVYACRYIMLEDAITESIKLCK